MSTEPLKHLFDTVNSSLAASIQPAPEPTSFRVLSDAERDRSMHECLTHWNPGQDVWVYGYGSLIWRPEFDYLEQRQALLRGYHRSLCLWSRINRGTPEQPGLVFGLDAGGSCRGMAFRIAGHQVPDVFDALWRREMPSGAYTPRWLPCRTNTGNIQALTFVMNRNTDAYVPRMPLEQLIDVINAAHGINGPCIEYVLETAEALKRSEIQDKRLQSLVDALESRSIGSFPLCAV
ncbi:gamma-glutamylcyclotransferase [Paenalcaligenes niemegkensis]|uniref:gamma-glutamylcyclotransferase n=1 Tax=Paenalcaligenes niemegkensis TaxID=2895469 RepID=UPI00356755EC